MKKTIISLIVVALIVVAALGVFIYWPHKKALTPTAHTSATPLSSSFKQACDVLTTAVADKVLGPGAMQVDASASDVVTSERSVTSCVYNAQAQPNGQSATVTVRASAADEAQTNFNAAKMSDTQDVTGLGVLAFWSPTYGQLNLLKGGNWVILSVGDQSGGNRTLDAAKQLANEIIPNL